MKTKMNLETLKIQSFVTTNDIKTLESADRRALKGGSSDELNTKQCSWIRTGCDRN